MKVLLTRPKTDSSLPWYFPSGLGYIARALVDAGCEVTVVDPEVEDWDFSDHACYLQNAQYDVLGISALINKYKYVSTLAQASKEFHPDSRIVLGGNITGPIWELLLQETQIDVCVIGEGEKTVQELLLAFEKNSDLEAVKGIAFRRNGKPFLTPLREPIADLDEIRFPAYEMFPMEAYLTTPGKLARSGFVRRDLSMITSRGCPYQCTFCYRPPWEKVRYRSCENVMSEVSYLVNNYDLDGIVFNDELTLVNKARVYKICAGIEKIGILWGCVGRVNTVDKDLLRRIYNAGCRWITYGIESGSQIILNEMRKNVTVEQAKNAVIWTKRAGLNTNPTFMIGYPSESSQTVMETVKFMQETNLHPDSLFFATAYPGTKLFEQVVKLGRVTANVEEYLLYIDGKDAHSLIANLTEMSDQKLIGLRDEVLRKVAVSSIWALFKQILRTIQIEGWRNFCLRVVRRLKHWLRI